MPLHRLYKRPNYNYSKIKLDNSFLKQNFIKVLTTHFNHNLKDAGYFIRVSIKSSKRSFLKHVMMFIISLVAKQIRFPTNNRIGY